MCIEFVLLILFILTIEFIFTNLSMSKIEREIERLELVLSEKFYNKKGD